MKTDPDFVARPSRRRGDPIGGSQLDAGGEPRGFASEAPAHRPRPTTPARMSQTEAAALPVGVIT